MHHKPLPMSSVCVRLSVAGHAVALHPSIHASSEVDEYSVVYADAAKMVPHIAFANRQETMASAMEKREHVLAAIKRAKCETFLYTARPEEGHSMIMPKVSALRIKERDFSKLDRRGRPAEEEVIRFSFTYGKTRATQLAKQGAEFIPLLVANKQVEFMQNLIGKIGKAPDPLFLFAPLEALSPTQSAASLAKFFAQFEDVKPRL
jgi:hypothetical protein